MGEQENNKVGGGGGNNVAMVVDEAAAAKGKSLGAADPRLQAISDAIRVVPHFPKPGPPPSSPAQSFIRLTRTGRTNRTRGRGARPPRSGTRTRARRRPAARVAGDGHGGRACCSFHSVLSRPPQASSCACAGIMFNDITELLLRPGVFKDAVDMFVERYRGMGIAAVAGKSNRKLNQPPPSQFIIGSS